MPVGKGQGAGYAERKGGGRGTGLSSIETVVWFSPCENCSTPGWDAAEPMPHAGKQGIRHSEFLPRAATMQWAQQRIAGPRGIRFGGEAGKGKGQEASTEWCSRRMCDSFLEYGYGSRLQMQWVWTRDKAVSHKGPGFQPVLLCVQNVRGE